MTQPLETTARMDPMLGLLMLLVVILAIVWLLRRP